MLKKYLNILNLPENPSKAQIKKAYYKKAKQFHPDLNKSPKAQSQFLEINEAFNALYHNKFNLKNSNTNNAPKYTSYQRMKDEIRRENYRKQYANQQNHQKKQTSNHKHKPGFAYQFKNNFFTEEYDSVGRVVCYIFFAVIALFGSFLTVLPFVVFLFVFEQFSIASSVMSLLLGLFILRFAFEWYVDMKRDFAASE